MTSKFLKAKHWQLFILIFLIPLIIQGIGMFQFFDFFQILEMNGDISPRIMMASIVDFIRIMIISTALGGSLMLGWLWSVGIGLQNKIREDLRMKTNLFKAALIFSIIYFAGFFGVILNFENLLSMTFSEELFFRIFPIILSLHLLAIVAVIYALIFAAKTIKTAELQRKLKSDEFIGEFFMICFFIVGIWILQPQINKIYDYEAENYEIN